ncbi:carbohydrate ABC transporter permease [Egibacter rhizosphaerae]|uniref:Carbohydrate ABC transporter permease n=1 Tax=Egibacter rhizosphaerae TaxID=1670831 RepID=A0A411YDG7_9ACTN|nr:carbohydrate ABC transporter permease [Egibacter rhizosphaerae]QBI19216.1 carbohydrate ABC transporter permease [Egibacter rhizosphaerae]
MTVTDADRVAPAPRRTSEGVPTRRAWPRRALVQLATYAGAIAVGLFAFGPILWMLITALKPDGEILTSTPVFIPSEVRWDRLANVVTGDFAVYLRNSILVSGATVVLSVAAAAMAGWVLARYPLPLKRYLLILVLSAQMFPFVVLLIPIFILMRQVDLLGTHTGLILAYLSFTTPLVVWILRGFFQSIPIDLEEAAMVDGATRVQAFRRIILPLAMPGVAAASVFGFISAWNELLFALSFNRNNPELHTLPVALQQFIGRDTTDFGMIMAASAVFTVPVVVFFLFTHKRMTQGMVMGATKG